MADWSDKLSDEHSTLFEWFHYDRNEGYYPDLDPEFIKRDKAWRRSHKIYRMIDRFLCSIGIDWRDEYDVYGDSADSL
jgi:hypothetical protein